LILTRNVGYSVALLMNREVAEVTEENDVCVGALAVHADAADRVVVDRRAVVFAVRLHVEVRFFFQSAIREFQLNRQYIIRKI
jgi:hypothetical protein